MNEGLVGGVGRIAPAQNGGETHARGAAAHPVRKHRAARRGRPHLGVGLEARRANQQPQHPPPQRPLVDAQERRHHFKREERAAQPVCQAELHVGTAAHVPKTLLKPSHQALMQRRREPPGLSRPTGRRAHQGGHGPFKTFVEPEDGGLQCRAQRAQSRESTEPRQPCWRMTRLPSPPQAEQQVRGGYDGSKGDGRPANRARWWARYARIGSTPKTVGKIDPGLVQVPPKRRRAGGRDRQADGVHVLPVVVQPAELLKHDRPPRAERICGCVNSRSFSKPRSRPLFAFFLGLWCLTVVCSGCVSRSPDEPAEANFARTRERAAPLENARLRPRPNLSPPRVCKPLTPHQVRRSNQPSRFRTR